MDILENNGKGVKNNLQALTQRVAYVLLEAEKEFGSDTPLSTLNLLFLVPLTGSIPVQSIRRMSTMTEAGVSRVLSTLNSHNCCNRRQLEKLIEITIDDKDRRYRHVSLTKRGREVVTRFMQPVVNAYE